MDWYIVVARLAHDDEDTLLTLQADSQEHAIKEAEVELREGDEDEEGERREFYLNYVMLCGATEPQMVYKGV